MAQDGVAGRKIYWGSCNSRIHEEGHGLTGRANAEIRGRGEIAGVLDVCCNHWLEHVSNEFVGVDAGAYPGTKPNCHVKRWRIRKVGRVVVASNLDSIDKPAPNVIVEDVRDVRPRIEGNCRITRERIAPGRGTNLNFPICCLLYTSDAADE